MVFLLTCWNLVGYFSRLVLFSQDGVISRVCSNVVFPMYHNILCRDIDREPIQTPHFEILLKNKFKLPPLSIKNFIWYGRFIFNGTLVNTKYPSDGKWTSFKNTHDRNSFDYLATLQFAADFLWNLCFRSWYVITTPLLFSSERRIDWLKE